MKKFITLALLSLSLLSSAQYPSIYFNNISLNQGLSQSCVVDIGFDSKGLAWLATQDGLNRYDGKDFFVSDKKFDDITSGSTSRLGKIITGDGNCLWIITKGGTLEKFDLPSGVFFPLSILSGKVKQVVTCALVEGNSRLWIGTASGKLFLYNRKTSGFVKEISIPATTGNHTINALLKSQDGKIWIAGNNIGYLDTSELIFLPVAMPVRKGILFSCLSQSKDGGVWIGTLGQGLFFKKNNDAGFTQWKGFSKTTFSTGLVIESILTDNSGKVWVGTYGKGLFIIDAVKENIQQLVNEKRNPGSIPFNDVLTIKQDVNNGIWIGTDGGGASYFNGLTDNIMLFNNQTVPPKIETALIRSISADSNGNIWAGTTNNGLTQINYKKPSFKTWHFLSYKKDIYNPERIISILNDKDNVLWIGTQGNGLILFDPVKGKILKWFHPEAKSEQAMQDGTAWCIYPAKNGKVWVGTGNSGLYLMAKKIGIEACYLPDAIVDSTDAIRCIVAMSDTILCIGLEKTGILYFNSITKIFIRPTSTSLNIFLKEGVTIKCLYYNKPILWIGTGGKGILAFNTLDGATTQLTEKDGLPNNTVYGILPDGNGHLWASTNKGLSRFSQVLNDNKIVGAFKNYTSGQGLQSNEFNTGAYFRAPDGNLLFGGIDGLNLFNPIRLDEIDRNIAVAFTKIFVDNEPLSGDASTPFTATIRLTNQNHSVAFNFAALDFFSSRQYHYYYKLVGFDENWIDAGQRNYSSYTNVPPGNYDFFVKYIKPGSTGTEVMAKMQLEIQGPVWKKEWFIIAMVFLSFILVYGLYRYKIGQVLKLLRVRQSIATDLHDDIGSTLSNINILTALSKKSLKDTAKVIFFLDRISEEAQASSQSLDDIIWSINTKNDNWEETFSRMRRYAAEVLESSNILYVIKLEKPAGVNRLKTDKRRDVFLIYKEILNNIHKHAAATNVSIEMGFAGQQLVMVIRDNGKGFDKKAHTHRNGLKNLSSRVTRWKGKIDIETNVKGTIIRICI